MFTKLIDALKATRRTIVFTEGPDARILEATDRLLKEDLMDVILIGNVDEVKAAAEKGNFCICKAQIIDPATYEMFLVGYDMLTPTEREILEALADGSSPRELSEQRNCSESTIATHRKNIYRKLGIHKAYQLKICIALLRQEREAQN